MLVRKNKTKYYNVGQKMNETGRIQAIERMVGILDLFTVDHPELRFKEIVSDSGLNKSTAFNLVNTMEQLGLLEQDEITKAYRLGTHLLRLGEIAKKSITVIDVAKPFMTDLRDKVNETVQLARLENGLTIYLDKVESFQPIKTHSERGDAIPAYATGLGKVLLAFESEEYIEKYIPEFTKRFTDSTVGSRAELKRRLQKIKEEGFATDNGEYINDLICYAAPIFDYRNKVKYAISISVPSYRMDDQKKKEIKEAVLETARKISREMGYIMR